MLETLDHIDRKIFLFFNEMHSPWSDQFWQIITNIPTWIPLYALLLFFIIKTFKKDSIYLIAGLLLVVLVCDQFTSTFMKPYFARLRPCHDPELSMLVHVVKSCGGQFGFASGHACNSFGIAMFTWMTFRNLSPWTWLFFLWAFMVAFSRIMVGVHYPGDIFVGGLLGLFFGWILFKLTESLYFRLRLLPLIRN